MNGILQPTYRQQLHYLIAAYYSTCSSSTYSRDPICRTARPQSRLRCLLQHRGKQARCPLHQPAHFQAGCGRTAAPPTPLQGVNLSGSAAESHDPTRNRHRMITVYGG